MDLSTVCGIMHFKFTCFGELTVLAFRLNWHILQINKLFLVSDTGFSGRISDFRREGKIFSCQHLDVNLS